MKSILYPDFFRPPALPAVLLTPAQHLKLELKLVNSQPLRYHSPAVSVELLHSPRWELLPACPDFPSLCWEHKSSLSPWCCCTADLAGAWQWHRSLFGEARRIWIPAQDAFGTDGQRTNRFPATWNCWKETIAGGKEKNQNQGHVLSLPIAAPA